jgi:hypothetical protein
MPAAPVSDEKFTIAVKNAFIVRNMVFTIIAVEVQLKLIEVKAVPIFSVSFCLFYLTYQSRIHCINLLFRGNIKKHTRGYPRVFNQRAWVLPEISA